ncbi:alpha-hydroxy-acid oxidizing protein [Vibrio lentus]|nr:alpha-hydroxy-acid oxidizing protein [Vibrio lentus]
MRFGADGIVVSNHGGRQLDGVLSSAKATACHDCRRGKRRHQDVSGRLWHSYRLDVVRMMAMGADCTLLLVALLSTRVSSVSDKQVLRTCSTFTTRDARCDDLTGAKTIKDLTRDSLVWPD